MIFTFSLSYSPIYGIHTTYIAIIISSLISTLLTSFWIIFVEGDITFFATAFLLLWCSSMLWINDLIQESYSRFTTVEITSLYYAIKLVIITEILVFVSLFVAMFNFEFTISSCFLWFSFLPYYSLIYSIPFSNLLVLFFSSFALQSALIVIKIGFLDLYVDFIAQLLTCGILFTTLQFIEFTYSILSISDSTLGSIIFSLTGLHGLHLIIGLFLFILCYFFTLLSRYSKLDFIYIEYLNNITQISYYWHLIDAVWFCVFTLILLVF